MTYASGYYQPPYAGGDRAPLLHPHYSENPQFQPEFDPRLEEGTCVPVRRYHLQDKNKYGFKPRQNFNQKASREAVLYPEGGVPAGYEYVAHRRYDLLPKDSYGFKNRQRFGDPLPTGAVLYQGNPYVDNVYNHNARNDARYIEENPWERTGGYSPGGNYYYKNKSKPQFFPGGSHAPDLDFNHPASGGNNVRFYAQQQRDYNKKSIWEKLKFTKSKGPRTEHPDELRAKQEGGGKKPRRNFFW